MEMMLFLRFQIYLVQGQLQATVPAIETVDEVVQVNGQGSTAYTAVGFRYNMAVAERIKRRILCSEKNIAAFISHGVETSGPFYRRSQVWTFELLF
jgi:hypothetical protein